MAKRSRPSTSRFSLVAVGLVVAAVIAGAGLLAGALLRNPFSTHTVDRTAPVLLKDLVDLSRYDAASGHFEVLIDEEKDVQYLPSAIAGERVMFVGVGSVDAYVDFSTLGESALTVSPDRKSVTVVLPHATYGDPVVDPAQSHVASRKRGLFNRVAGMFNDNPTSEGPLYEAAGAKMARGRRESELLVRAEHNTEVMLRGLLTDLGFENVTIRFQDPPNPY